MYKLISNVCNKSSAWQNRISLIPRAVLLLVAALLLELAWGKVWRRTLTQAVEGPNVRGHEVADAAVSQRVRHAAEGRCPRRGPDQVLQDQVPPNEERHKLSHCNVAVCVRRARGLGHPHPKLCITHPCRAPAGLLMFR